MAVVEAHEFRSEAKRESQHLHAGPAGNKEMTKLMEENNDGEHKQEENDVADKAMAQRIETVKKKLGHPIPLTQGRRPCQRCSKMGLRQFEARGWQPNAAPCGQRRWHRPRTSAAPDCRNVPSRSSWPRPAVRSRQI